MLYVPVAMIDGTVISPIGSFNVIHVPVAIHDDAVFSSMAGLMLYVPFLCFLWLFSVAEAALMLYLSVSVFSYAPISPRGSFAIIHVCTVFVCGCAL
jgi:hypothetical protein